MSYWSDHRKLMQRPYDLSRKVWQAQVSSELYRKDKSFKKLTNLVQQFNQQNELLARKLENLIKENHMLKRMEVTRHVSPFRGAQIQPSMAGIRAKYIGSSVMGRRIRDPSIDYALKTERAEDRPLTKDKSIGRLYTERSQIQYKLLNQKVNTPLSNRNGNATDRSSQDSPIFTDRNQQKTDRSHRKDKMLKQQSTISITIAPSTDRQSYLTSQQQHSEVSPSQQVNQNSNSPGMYNPEYKVPVFQPFSLSQAIISMSKHMEQPTQNKSSNNFETTLSRPYLNPEIAPQFSHKKEDLPVAKSPQFGLCADQKENHPGSDNKEISRQPAIPAIFSSKKTRERSLSQRSKKQFISLVSANR